MGLLKDLRDFFFPRVCVCCGKLLSSQEEGLCVRCMASLPRTELLNTPENEMERRFWGIFPVERASALYYYARGGNVSNILYGMKYHGRRKLCVQMGRMIAAELMRTGFFDGIDCVMPVPLHKKRLRERGYNQSELLAIGISEMTGIPVETSSLIRKHNNTTQTHKSSFERWENVSGLFDITSRVAVWSGKHILLIDDVLTTGATISACIDALKVIPSIKISIVTLAWSKS